jgi:mRNA-degrading endonuclease RelE of RelBE toxin-antitoxin system
MKFDFNIKPSCKESINKHCKKNPILKKAISNKIELILKNPYHFKPLKYDLAGERRVHILKCFVLKFEIDETSKIVTFLFFGHHDEAYKI